MDRLWIHSRSTLLLWVQLRWFRIWSDPPHAYFWGFAETSSWWETRAQDPEHAGLIIYLIWIGTPQDPPGGERSSLLWALQPAHEAALVSLMAAYRTSTLLGHWMCDSVWMWKMIWAQRWVDLNREVDKMRWQLRFSVGRRWAAARISCYWWMFMLWVTDRTKWNSLLSVCVWTRPKIIGERRSSALCHHCTISSHRVRPVQLISCQFEESHSPVNPTDQSFMQTLLWTRPVPFSLVLAE